ncbi:MAG: ZIP family metal transporter [Oscillospiraceae bacterium]|nr:ZIP family metal transporter [Oscillospiraceae bacterium]
MTMDIMKGIMIPFIGTAIGSAGVFFMAKGMNKTLQRILTGFAAGVMVAASIWSLLIPAMEMAAEQGKLSFVPAAVGFWLGVIFLLVLDRVVPHMHMDKQKEGPDSNMGKNSLLVMAVALHNLPEGMAVGAIWAGLMSESSTVSLMSALALSVGIAIQNLPEGAIISMPLHSEGVKKSKAFGYGIASGIVEPLGALLTIMAARFVIPILPFTLSFAAGAMMYVVVEELIPEMSEGKHSNIGTIFFAVGFSLMMILDVALG